MYRQIIDVLNHFLNSINVLGTPLNPDAFQGIFVKNFPTKISSRTSVESMPVIPLLLSIKHT